MKQFQLQNVGMTLNENLFSNISLTISQGDRIGIVGNNGTGKTTLIKCLTGEIEPTEGKIFRPKDFSFAVVEQGIPNNLDHKSLYEVVAESLSPEDKDYNLWKVDIALDTLKATQLDRNKLFKELSGGWQRLALITRAWINNADFLFLDEPTNHLDVQKILILEDLLNNHLKNTALVCISHDRRLLDNCTSKTLFVREFNSAFLNHSFSKAKNILNSNDIALMVKQEEELKQIQRLEKSAHELKQIGINNFSDSALKKSSQISKRAEIAKSQLIKAPIEIEKEIKLESNVAPTKRLITINNLNVVSPENKQLFKIESLTISQGDRIVISGENGSGKSTLLKTINLAFQNRDLSVDNDIYITPSVKLGLMDQHLSTLPLNLSIKEYLANEFSLTNQQIINYLVNIGFSYELQNKKIKLLSYGQRSRLFLLALRLLEPNFYILDEPTNHLDISGQEQLESEIIKNNATCLIVSHDRAFASTLGTKFYEIYDFTLKEVNKPEDFSVIVCSDLLTC